MTRNSKAAFGFCLLSVVLFTCVASAQLVFSGVGSSAMLDTFAVAAFTQVCSARVGSDCHHWSAGGKNSNDNQYWAQAVDSRNSGIPVEPGTVFIAWDNNTNPIRVWSYLSVDSAVGQRLFFANPRATLQLDGGVLTVPGQNQVPAAILLNRQTGFTQSDGTTGIPTAVLTAVQTQFTAAVTDVRPEDAKYATNRVLTTYNVNGNGLGYNTAGASCFQPPDSWTVTGNLGCPIYDNWGGRSVPVQFSLPGGTDPYTLTKVPPATSIPVGAAPIIFLYNSSNSAGLGATSGGVPILRDISFSNASQVWNGAQGGAAFLNPALANVPLTIFLNEPLSGAMNTAEFSSFRTFLAPKFAVPTNSQEKGINLANACSLGSNCPNPLFLPTTNGGGIRQRAIGTGGMVSGSVVTRGLGGLRYTADSIGYAFFSFGNVNPQGVGNPFGGAAGVGRYVTLDGVDPIQTAYTNGQLPTCAAPCPVAPGTSFSHLRDGSYRAWSIFRLVTDTSGPNLTNAQALVTAAQNGVNSTVPDFVPFGPTPDGDPGLQYLRSHFKITGVTDSLLINNGTGNPVSTSAMTESGSTVSATLASNPFVQGQTVVVSGVTPAGYNGTFKLLTSSGLLITYSDPTTHLTSATVQGTVTAAEVGGDVGGCPFRLGGPNATQINVRLNGATANSSDVPWPGGSCDLSPNHN